MAKRLDELDKYYNPIRKLETWLKLLFWISLILSIVVIFADILPASVQDVPAVLFSLSVVAHFVLNLYEKFSLLPSALEKRRKQFLSDSLGVALIPESTKNYYNNSLPPSIVKLGVNLFENTFFTHNIATRMAQKERRLIFIYAMAWLGAVTWRGTNLDFVIVITQALFSGEIIQYWINLELLRIRSERTYSKLYNFFLKNDTDVQNNYNLAVILDSFSSYEALKAESGISLSDRVFKELNLTLSREWEEIKSKTNIQ